MKKINEKNNLLTKDYLDKTLDNKLKKYATKDYLDQKLDSSFKKSFQESKEYTDKRFDRLHKYLDNRFEPLEKMAKDVRELKDFVQKTLDFLVGKYTKFEDENTAGHEQYKRVDEKLGNHEKRISVLEKKTVYKAS